MQPTFLLCFLDLSFVLYVATTIEPMLLYSQFIYHRFFTRKIVPNGSFLKGIKFIRIVFHFASLQT